MSKYKIGQQINGFVLKERFVKKKKSYGVFVCPYCGKDFETRIDNITSRHTKSCGCQSAASDLSGQNFGRWTVIEPASNKKGYWVCACDCGCNKEVCGYSLTSGKSQSCGCLRDEKASIAMAQRNLSRPKKVKIKKLSNAEKIIGQTFGELTVLGDSGERIPSTGEIKFLCQCSCGNTTKVTSAKLKSGHTTSCGHLLSKGEERIIKTLLSLNIKFETQKTFEDLISEKGVRLRFDFYLSDFNCCIEYDGEMHSGNGYRGWFTPQMQQQLKERDKKKEEYCAEKGIKLVRISYKDLETIDINFMGEVLSNLGKV